MTPLLGDIKKHPHKTSVIFIAFVGLMLLFLFSREGGAPTGFKPQNFKAGHLSKSDLVVDRDLTYVDGEATRQKQEAEALLVAPVFKKNPPISARAKENYRTFSLNFQMLLRKGTPPASLFLQMQSLLPLVFTKEEIEEMAAQEDIYQIIGQGKELLDQYLEEGIFRFPSGNTLPQSHVELWEFEEGTVQKHILPSEELITLENYAEDIGARATFGAFSSLWLPMLQLLLSAFLEENAFYDETETEIKRQAARAAVEPVTRQFLKGERIIQRGTLVTEEDMAKVRALGRYASAASSYNLFGTLIVLMILFILGIFFLSPPLAFRLLKGSQLLFFLAALILLSLISFFLIRFFNPSVYPVSVFLPTAMVSMMVAIILSPQMGKFMAVFSSLSYLIQTGMDSYGFLFAFVTGIVGTITVINVEKRGGLIRSSFLLAVVGGLILFGIGLLERRSIQIVFSFFGLGFINGLGCGILTLGLLPFVEHLMNSATPFRLRELSDLNAPLFKRMLVLAPGTYNHSIAVANLAESAAREIGANALLSRVGGYYHDIGKIEQAEYFAENQTAVNKHDDLKSSLSIAIIKSHVKIGVEKGKELALPREVIEIIAQHHGSGLISYFYSQAIKEQADNAKIKREDFSYTGLPPMSREAAIVMLSDSVEAASRTLKKPNIAKLEKFVWEIIMNRIKDDQLSRCDLTFKDLTTIKTIFVRILAGYFHTRVEYPKEEALRTIAGGRLTSG